MKKVEIYTDGACSGNPGPGGWAAILFYKGKQKTISGGEKETTNNRMELMGVIQGLKALKEKCNVTVYTDSAYTANAFKLGWIAGWQQNCWKTSSNKPVLNKDLWEQLADLVSKHEVTFVKVKGHADNKYNNMADEAAVAASKKF